MGILPGRISNAPEQSEEEDVREGKHPGEILEGPQSYDEAISQDEIDKLLAEFD
jgi:hypothetical protein